MYLKKERKNIEIPTIPTKGSLIYEYELKAAAIYELITNSNSLTFDLNNKPITATVIKICKIMNFTRT